MEVKQVIVIRRDLKMRRGKEIAQGAHAAMIWMSEAMRSKKHLTNEQREWLEGSFTKVTLQVSSEEELLEVFNKAKSKGLTVHIVTDAGKTEFDGVPTRTAIAIGPHEESKINEITGELKLY
jgi:PTH2 family peptidyl-tRNA hydrolase